jgi:hypothetical protein
LISLHPIVLRHLIQIKREKESDGKGREPPLP